MPNRRHSNDWEDDRDVDWVDNQFDPGEDWADDPSEDDDDNPTIRCPHCREPVYEDAPRCPYCNRDIDEVERPSRKPLWITLGAIACLYAAFRWVFG